MDIRGDPYGLLAAHPVAPLVSLHHIDAVSPMFPSHTHLDSLKSLFRAYQVDPARILQQSFCYDHRRNWSISVSWGYTAQLYPWLVPAHILDKPLQTFQTWRSRSQGPFTFNTRQVTSDPCEQPVIYFLEEVREVAKGETMSSYGTAVAQPEKACQRPDYAPVMAVQRIKVSTLKMSPQDWKKVPPLSLFLCMSYMCYRWIDPSIGALITHVFPCPVWGPISCQCKPTQGGRIGAVGLGLGLGL